MTIIGNSLRRLAQMFPQHFGGSTKHDFRKDFGYPDALTFHHLHGIYRRNGFARAAVDKTILKTWQDSPEIWESDEPTESRMESDIRQRFTDLRVWQRLAEADRRSLVGGYAGAILRFADSKRFDQPVDTVPGGMAGLVEIVPVWAGQLTVSEWDSDQTSESYGQPKLFGFNEAAVGDTTGIARSFNLHPDRVLIWSRDGTVHDTSFLEPGYNQLLDMEKISGAGGEGFWKNAKSAPILEIDKEAKVAEMAQAMGIDAADLADKMEDQVADWNKGFDSLLMLMGMQAKTLSITLPSPEHFFNVALQGFCASVNCPQKILVGNQNGNRASLEDAEEWARVNMARRNDTCIPAIRSLIGRLERVSILPERDWAVNWSDLTESSMGEKIARAKIMADINQASQAELVYLPEEIRAVTGHEPLSAADLFRSEDEL